MSNFPSRKGRDLQNTVPGCMGRMINVFDLGGGMAGTKLLTEKAHRDGSPVRRGRPDMVKKVLDPVESHVDDKPVTREPRRSSSSKKCSRTPVKMLMAQEMSKEIETGQKPPSVVARLMGLDALPVQKSTPSVQRAVAGSYKPNSYTIGEAIQGCQQQENVYRERTKPRSIHPFQTHVNEHREYKDVYEVWQQPSRINRVNDHLSRERYDVNPNEKRIALVRQKFMEAKRLATNQKLLQSKEFQDALEVLSSNRDLFLKFLEEPTSQLSKHSHELRRAPLLTQTKCITVLKPSKTLEKGSDRELKKEYLAVEANGWGKNKPNLSSSIFHPKSGTLSQPTRIVVLKPSPGKPRDMKAPAASTTSSGRLPDGGNLFGELSTTEATGSREIAKEITRQMRESLGNRRDENLLSSGLSNGYTGYESSFNRSEHENMEEECGLFTYSHALNPTSRHSWDFVNRYDSPYSLSSFSRASYSPESSVITEAKKRLSERLAMVTSSSVNQEHRQLQRFSSTLGEMLAVPEKNREKQRDKTSMVSSSIPCSGQQDQMVASSSSLSSRNQDEIDGKNSPNSLQRSKSVPVSVSAYENIRPNEEVSDSLVDKSIVQREMAKPKSVKFSFKGKVSSLFFSNSKKKKSSQEKHIPPSLAGSPDEVQSCNSKLINKKIDDPSQCITSYRLEEDLSPIIVQPLSTNLHATPETEGLKQEAPAGKEDEKPTASENASQDLEQPSPVSVLEAPFEEDASSSSSQSRESANLECQRAISRSPLIESVARSLSWEEDAQSEGIRSDSNKHPSSFTKPDSKEQERLVFVQALLSSSGLGNETPNTVLNRWHPQDCPLDQSLLDKFLERKEEGAKFRERRSIQRLLFDCVNAALLEISGTNILLVSCPLSTKAYFTTCKCSPKSTSLSNEVLSHISEWFSDSKKLASDCSENSSLMVDCVISKEVRGRQWDEMMGSETAEIGREIEGQVLQELVSEALDGLNSGWFH